MHTVLIRQCTEDSSLIKLGIQNPETLGIINCISLVINEFDSRLRQGDGALSV